VQESVIEAVTEACQRISTPQRGGVWVKGRRVGCSCDRYLFMVADRSATMNDVYYAFEQLTDLLLKL
jgi:hypothetical protein